MAEQTTTDATRFPRMRLIGRHPAALDFVRRELPALSDVPAETGTVDPTSVSQDDVLVGVVPMALVARAAGAIVIEFSGAPPRGAEWDLAAMDAAGARLVGYRVTPVAVDTLLPPPEGSGRTPVLISTGKDDLDFGVVRAASAGANRGTVRLDLSSLTADAQGVTLRASRDSAILADGPTSDSQIVVIWHKGDAGTFRGIGRPTADDPVGARLGEDELVWTANSSSGGGDVSAAVLRLRPGAEPVNVLTSGYQGRRGWTVRTIAADGSITRQPLADWRASKAPAMAL